MNFRLRTLGTRGCVHFKSVERVVSMREPMMKLLLLVGLIFVHAALAQTLPPPAQQTRVFSSTTTLVLVPALVKTKAGEPVFTQTAKDFALTDDGVEQTPHAGRGYGQPAAGPGGGRGDRRSGRPASGRLSKAGHVD